MEWQASKAVKSAMKGSLGPCWCAQNLQKIPLANPLNRIADGSSPCFEAHSIVKGVTESQTQKQELSSEHSAFATSEVRGEEIKEKPFIRENRVDIQQVKPFFREIKDEAGSRGPWANTHDGQVYIESGQ